MKPAGSQRALVLGVCGFSALVIAAAFRENPYTPVLAIAGEASAGTWLSGALLIAAATLALTAGTRRGPIWYGLAAFFAMLALDERFTFHENLKARLGHAFPALQESRHWLLEAPVLLCAVAGAFIAVVMWKRFRDRNRMLLIAAVAFGSGSVGFDVLRLGAFPEDGMKILAEILLVCALSGELDPAETPAP